MIKVNSMKTNAHIFMVNNASYLNGMYRARGVDKMTEEETLIAHKAYF